MPARRRRRLCEYVQHLSLIDYICVSASLEHRVVEYVDHLHEHFEDPVVMKNGRLHATQAARLLHHHETGEPGPLRVPRKARSGGADAGIAAITVMVGLGPRPSTSF